ncbi:BREX-2 system adenine-specific DNA-methyltransferase PglX [Streptomyces sp. 378]|uniref:BREX-2 system adenine-specific DNA-methyltransferase PglX n=1 Tax=Streptomyces sp. 378 TaxID=3049412 RepID=UPI0024C2904E|nr:BREX-2 system adenine-specific DNA-methyltransferase PglX [Streptomyces sp. 378]MDK1343794.1 BREX-2 system adenine-specific DNA-methyltransferase PglX [Streptomyces sp. 378]
MIDRKALLNDLKQQVKAVETDLGRQVKALGDVGARLKAEYDQARKLGRTAATWTSWLDERVTQVAVAWVLGTVFVRFCEDNRLIPEPYLTGPDGDRRELAESRYDAYVESDEDPTYRGWLEKAFEELGQGQAGRLLFDKRHNPLYQVPLSHDGARDLVEFWRGRDEAGVLVHDFTDPLNEDGTEGWDTRFLGDLYQDLSEAARKTYALLQTPEFVEEFILDRTMNPAVREFGYEELKMIDPTCGSGHFVLGAFRRLVRLWGEGQPGRDVHERVRAALDSVHGVDINPFAVAIARFRLLIAAMAASGVRTLEETAKYEWPVHLAVGDSLIKARRSQQGNLFGEVDEDLADELAEFKYTTEDVHQYPEILKPGWYHVVVGNPPYITVKDKKLNELYRELYPACAGTYALSVPFAQRFFELAIRGDAEGRGYGMVGKITANSFMKREFGTKLIEGYFGHAVELTEVVDTSGAYIPGHGTPTVILVGKQRGGAGRSPVIRTVRSVQGEPSAPENAEEGLVWQAIVEQIDKPGSVSQWVSVDDLDRARYFAKKPWILTDGGLELVEALATTRVSTLKPSVARIGFYGDTHADDALTMPARTLRNRRAEQEFVKRIGVGDEVRDYELAGGNSVIHPYDSRRSLASLTSMPNIARLLWPSRTELGNRSTFSGGTYFRDGRSWWEWHQLPKDTDAHPWSLNFAFVATHNHVVLDRSGCAFTRTAPVIKLREGASEEEHVRLLGLLNSSTAGFWLRQVSHDKGRPGADVAGADEPWEHRFEFTGTKLEEFPLPSELPAKLGTALDGLAQELAATSPSAIASNSVPVAAALREAREKWETIRGRMIAIQEELDWEVYSLYGLLDQEMIAPAGEIPVVASSERAFAIVLARKMEHGEVNTSWFRHHNHKFPPTAEIPAHWPAPYREIVQKRIDAIESNRAIGMVERPEYKRRWATEGWDALQEKALRSWLLDRMENRDHWFDENGQPTILTLSRLTDGLSRDEDFVSVATLYAPRKELAKVVAELISDEHVPFLSTLRYKPSGLKKRADWEEVWDLQRKEDAAPDEPAKRKIRDSIPVPPKYTSADFLRPSYWRARGKLDVPKERFISYGQTNAATPELYGWAGWDHQEQAQALATYFTNTALSTEEITPFLAGLLELQPWLSQWHNESDMLYSGSPADFFAGYRQQKQGEHGLTDDDLRNWRPPAATRGRRAAAKQ